MENISINEFQLVTSAGGAYILLSLGDGQGGRIAAGTFTEQFKPSIQNGVWFIGSQTTGITARGEDGKSVRLRQGSTGIEWAYVDEENWKVVVPYSELKLNFDDLTEEQKGQLKMTLDDLSEEDIALLQQPARDMIATLESTNTQMQAAKNDAQDTADHPTYIGVDYFVYKWNKSTKVYDKTDIYVKGEQGEQGEQGVQGEKGENGTGSGNVLVNTSGLKKGKQYVFTPNQNGSAEGDFVEVTIPEIDTNNLATKKDLNSKQDKIAVVEHGTSDTSFVLTPNVFHKWGEVSSLKIIGMEQPSDTGVYNEYMFEFVSGATATTLSLPSSVKFGKDVTIEPNKTYQVSIVDYIGVIVGV